ncbi:MAG: APC family permease, partial [Gemmatimonadota bacterium]
GQSRAGLLKVLGVAFGVAVIVGNTVGVGILRTPGEIAAHLPNAAIFLLLWLSGGLYALMGALSMAELGAMIPRSGGQYVFVRRALGEYPGFVVGWSDWISTAGSVAFVSMVFAEYTVQLIPGLAQYQSLLALVVIAVFTAVLWAGVRTGDRTQQITSLIKALGLIGLAIACLVVSGHAPAIPPKPVPHGASLITAVVVSFQAIIYTYDGWNGTFYFSGELTDPGREIPRATILGVISVIVVYLLLNIAFLKVVPIGTMAGDPFVAGTAARAVFGTAGDVIIRIIVVVGILSAVNAILFMASRVPVAMAEDGLISRVATDVSASGTPRVTLLASALVAGAFVLSGTFNQVLALLAFFFVLNYAMSFTSLFVLRRREPDTPRPYRAPGYPFVTGIALLGAVAFLVSGFFGDRANSVRSVIVLALSYPLYRVFRYAIRRGR